MHPSRGSKIALPQVCCGRQLARESAVVSPGSLHTVVTAFCENSVDAILCNLCCICPRRSCLRTWCLHDRGAAARRESHGMCEVRVPCGSLAARFPGRAGGSCDLHDGRAAVTAVILEQFAAPLDRWPGVKLLLATLSPIGNQIVVGVRATRATRHHP